MSIMEDGSRKIAETGVYRLFFDYGLSRDSYTNKTIYSKEFTIKENKKAAVIITADKTEYEQGEIIKIIVRNGLNLPIFYSGGERFWFIEKFEDEKWKNLGYERERAFQLPVLENGKEVCYIRVYERPDLIGLESNSEISHAWNQKICPLHRATERPFEPELIEAGQYRLGFNYGLSKSLEDPYELADSKIIYSNEFTIKEKRISL